MHDILPHLNPGRFPPIRRNAIEILQINIGLRCNLACLHCHTNSNPHRKEAMTSETIEQVLEFLQLSGIKVLDITGGAPELHPRFRDLVETSRNLGVQVMDRCNLTVLEEPEHRDLPGFLAEQRVEIIASLPCYTKGNVDGQRGRGVFESSIRVLQTLNKLGYGQPDSDLILNLVYNPTGPYLPPPQTQLETDYKRELAANFGIVFNQLFTLCNMPVNRFGSTLISRGQFNEYMTLLRGAHREANLGNVMCRTLISVDWQGYVYDCDFNQMLGLPLLCNGSHAPTHLSDLLNMDLAGSPIAVRDHCFGCTAGQGSSCGGALTVERRK